MKMIYRIRLIFMIIIIIGLSSCVTAQLPKPDYENDVLVVIPKLMIDTRYSMSPVSYSLIIVLENVKTRKEERLNLNELSEDYQYTKDILPGKYLIKEIFSMRQWRSQRVYNKYLEVKEGKLTIFPYKFVIKIDDFYLYYDFLEIEKKDMDKIIAVLGEKNNFKLWSINKLK